MMIFTMPGTILLPSSEGTSYDMVLFFSIDGAQLYAKNQSDCWIAIWIILAHAPDGRYTKKRVLPATFMARISLKTEIHFFSRVSTILQLFRRKA
jgi:hypothetical protein